MDTEKLSQALEPSQHTLVKILVKVTASERAELVVSAVMRLIQQACKEAVPIKKQRAVDVLHLRGRMILRNYAQLAFIYGTKPRSQKKETGS